MSQSSAHASANVGDALRNARQLLDRHPDAAARQAREIIRAEPGIADAYLILAAALRRSGDEDGALEAERQALRVSAADPVLQRARTLLEGNKGADGEALLRRFLQDSPRDPEALRLLGLAAAKTGHLQQAEELARRALAFAPSFDEARRLIDEVLERQARSYNEVGSTAAAPPDGAAEFRDVIAANENALSKEKSNPKLWLNYGHMLRIAGRQADSIAAYRRAVEIAPTYGEAWWSLADLKTVRFTADDIAIMNKALESDDLPIVDSAGLFFALGKAFGDLDQRPESFAAYASGNAIKRADIFYDGAKVADYVARSQEAFTTKFFEERSGAGCDAPDPIFVLGMPRSGSTLVEQILASHPQIEGTEELVFMGNLATLFVPGGRPEYEGEAFIEALTEASAERLGTIGGAYMWKAARHRRSSRPHFIDKMPRNWLYLPLILLSLPNAKIVDVRRNPMDCCWSNFRQLYADSGEFSYDLQELGSYYREYVRMMDVIDRVLPGRVHRIFYEQLLAETEAQVRNLLDHIGVSFDERCLEFHKNRRAVKTSSSEQVRQPISGESIGQWRHYEEWLKPLEQALGDTVETYPAASAAGA
jgi:cytochrome c-type biogenesis protein CcmH/NrfG